MEKQPSRPDAVATQTTVFLVLSAIFLVGAVIADRIGHRHMVVFAGSMGLGMLPYTLASALLAIRRRRRRGRPDEGSEPWTVRWTTSSLLNRGALGSSLVLLLVSVAGFAWLRYDEDPIILGFPGLIGLFGAGGLAEALYKRRKTSDVILDARQLHTEIHGLSFEAHWPMVERAENENKGATLRWWKKNLPIPLDVPLGDFEVHADDVARVINHLIDHPADRERLGPDLVRAILDR